MTKILLSQQKIDSIKKELAQLKYEVLEHHEAEHENIKMSIREAASYDVTIGARQVKVRELEKILKDVEVLPDSVNSEEAVLGSWVELEDEDGNCQKYRLVHPLEADPKKGLLSVESPLGKKLLNKKKNEFIDFNDSRQKIANVE
jgi:transcription elongation factor GreA